MIPWSLSIRAQYEKTTVPQSSQERNQDSLNMKKLLCPRELSKESGHYDSLEPGYQSGQDRKAIMTIMSKHYKGPG